MKNIIEINNLSKSFKDVKAVDNLSFCVKQGEVFAFLGVNGAGKSTTINIICSQLSYDSGEILIDGEPLENNVEKIKKELGVVFQNSLLDYSLTVYENLESRAALYGIHKEQFNEKINDLACALDFKDILNRRVGRLSGGQRRRVDIARALIHNPKILILDEPTTGLDPQTRKMLWNVISLLRKQNNMTVFLTTHYMEEAADTDYVIILDKGKIAAEGTPLQLKNLYTGDFITLYNLKEDEIKLLNVPYEKVGDYYRIMVDNTSYATALITKHPEIFKDYEIIKGKMDDVFLAATGKTLNEGGNSQ